jgi:hypothetical protein
MLSSFLMPLASAILATDHNGLPCWDGFLLCPLHAPSNWGASWEHKALCQPLVFCYLKLLPAADALFLSPSLLLTPYLPLNADQPRTPI